MVFELMKFLLPWKNSLFCQPTRHFLCLASVLLQIANVNFNWNICWPIKLDYSAGMLFTLFFVCVFSSSPISILGKWANSFTIILSHLKLRSNAITKLPFLRGIMKQTNDFKACKFWHISEGAYMHQVNITTTFETLETNIQYCMKLDIKVQSRTTGQVPKWQTWQLSMLHKVTPKKTPKVTHKTNPDK